MAFRTGRILEFPDFRLLTPTEFLGNRALKANHQGAIGRNVIQRFPWQPEFPAYHPGLIKSATLEDGKKFRQNVLITDPLLMRLALEYAREHSVINYVKHLKETERENASRHAKSWVEAEDARRRVFFMVMKRIMASRTNKHIKIRELVRAYEQRLHELRIFYGKKWHDETLAHIKLMAKRTDEFVRWHKSELYSILENGAVVRLPTFGLPLALINGRVHGEVYKEMVDASRQWRKDQHFMTLPNGSLQRVHSGAGELLETVHARLALPLLHERLKEFDDWHATNSLISTPNNSLVRMAHQGQSVERAEFMAEEPTATRRLEGHREFRLSGQLITLPNGGTTPFPHHGNMPETVRASLYWPTRDEVQKDADIWHEGHKFTVTESGVLAPLTQVGQSFEMSSAVMHQPKLDDRRAAADLWHATNKYGMLPNGVYGPMKGSHDSLERIGFVAEQPTIDKRLARTDLWHETHKYQKTPNGGYAPLKGVGLSIEHNSAVFGEKIRDSQTQKFDQAVLGHRFVEMSNHSIGKLSEVGKQFESVLANVDEDKWQRLTADATKHALEKRAAEQRSLAELPRPTQVDPAKIERPPAEAPNLTETKASPLEASGSKALEAPVVLAEHRQKKIQYGLREIQKSMAAHEPTPSRLTSHAVAPDSSAAANLPIPTPKKSDKA